EIATPRDAHRVRLASLDEGPVRIIGWAVERRGPGLIYENHGTVGATVALLGRMRRQTLAAELADSRPQLIVFAFGTNEGFDDTLDPQQYAVDFRARVAALGQMAPGAAILVLGPPDGNRRARSCPPADRQAMRCSPASADPCRWREPPRLAAVRRVQREAAKSAGWAFWDWSKAMGGTCGIDRLAVADPPLAYPDHVHLTDLGYEESADVLYFDLMNAYAAWKRRGASGS
ncbi:MAG TPA: GDSL-type esterase/lipase family protein, partial [Stellaceae bacterium]|nr:GDSL-type esterase/lipase family protein [Stellaceae bacterium]